MTKEFQKCSEPSLILVFDQCKPTVHVIHDLSDVTHVIHAKPWKQIQNVKPHTVRMLLNAELCLLVSVFIDLNLHKTKDYEKSSKADAMEMNLDSSLTAPGKVAICNV